MLAREGRFDGSIDPTQNGEVWIQQSVIRFADRGPLVVFDVGANIGDWTVSVLKVARQLGRKNVFVHAFEPCHQSYRELQLRIQSEQKPNRAVGFQGACSSSSGKTAIYLVAEDSSSNSMHPFLDSVTHIAEEVAVTTIDEYCSTNSIQYITFLKSDTEGHDMAVLHGARQMISARKIGIIQFEYNQRWIFSRHYLYDAFDLLVRHGYRIGKITPQAVEFYPCWSPELETFHMANYLACLPECAGYFTSIPPWNRSGLHSVEPELA